MTSEKFLSQYKAVVRRIAVNEEIMKRDGYSASLCEENEELIKLRFSIENSIDKSTCNMLERAVLRKRYIESKPWEQISKELLYSVQHLHRIKKSALSKISFKKCGCFIFPLR